MKRIIVLLLILSLITGCSAKKEEPTAEELLRNRQQYLTEETEAKCKELFPEGHTEIVRHYGMVTINGIETAERMVVIIQPENTTKYIAVEFGSENENLTGQKDNDVFFINEEKEPELEKRAKEDYPEITSKTDWIVIKRKGKNTDEYDLLFTLGKEQLKDDGLLSEIVRLISEKETFTALIKDEEVLLKQEQIPAILLSIAYGLTYCPYEGELWQHEVWLSKDSQFDEERLENLDVDSLRRKLQYQMEHK